MQVMCPVCRKLVNAMDISLMWPTEHMKRVVCEECGCDIMTIITPKIEIPSND